MNKTLLIIGAICAASGIFTLIFEYKEKSHTNQFWEKIGATFMLALIFWVLGFLL